jgi:DNA-binding GntR family transcriptional regulator
MDPTQASIRYYERQLEHLERAYRGGDPELWDRLHDLFERQLAELRAKRQTT